MPLVSVAIPTFRRKTALAMTLTSLFAQTLPEFDVTIADQTAEAERYTDDMEIRTVCDALRRRGCAVTIHHRPQRRGLAEQRDFLVRATRAPYVHFVDDDVLLEPAVLERMLGVIQAEGCGFVGAAAAGLAFIDDVRPHQTRYFEPWEGRVEPEPFAPGAIPWERHHVNSAANVLHLERTHVRSGEAVRYKVAWVGGANVIYDRAKLESVGGFSFWQRLPEEHAGEEALVQFLLIRRYGGCAILPSGTYHLGLPTTIPDRSHEATALFASLLEEQHAAR